VTLAVLTPFTGATARKSGTRWWKRLLPVGEIDYEGRKLKFSREYLTDLANAFTAQAYDQVPFQLAPDDNRHTNDPERYAGEIAAMEVRNDGLWVGLDPTRRGDQVLTENPRLGVSARIVEAYDRADGKHFPAAIQHVLATLDPKIPRLGAWQTVEAANNVGITIDLSSATFAGEDQAMTGLPEFNETQQARLAQLLDLPEGQFAALLGSRTGQPEPAGEPGQPPAGESGTAPEGDGGELDLDSLTPEEVAEIIAGLSDEELAALEAEMEADELAGAGASLSGEAALALELANARTGEIGAQLGTIQAQLDAERYASERRQIAEDWGIPPYITDLARPLLQGTGRVVDLANGQSVDAGAIMRQVFQEFGKTARMLDLSGSLGSPVDDPGEDGQELAEARAVTVARFRKQTGV
jgi:hypothetical protein